MERDYITPHLTQERSSDNFKNILNEDINSESNFSLKICKLGKDAVSALFALEREEHFENILLYSSEEFTQFVSNKVTQHIQYAFPNQLYDKQIKEIEEEFMLTCVQKVKTLKNIIDQILKSHKGPNCVKQSNIIPHCKKNISQDLTVLTLHSKKCNSKLMHVKDSHNGEKSSYIICLKCRKCYNPNLITLACSHCKVNFRTAYFKQAKADLLLFPSTWPSYHCNARVNEVIKCISCAPGTNFYLNAKNNFLVCLDCKLEVNPRNIIWTCKICKGDFQSDVKVFNPVECYLIKLAIKRCLILQKEACVETSTNNYTTSDNSTSDYVTPCCNQIKLFHSKECKGRLLEGPLNHETIIVCTQCKFTNYKHKLLLNCNCLRSNQRKGNLFEDSLSIANNTNYANGNNCINSNKLDNNHIDNCNSSNNLSDILVTQPLNNSKNVENKNLLPTIFPVKEISISSTKHILKKKKALSDILKGRKATQSPFKECPTLKTDELSDSPTSEVEPSQAEQPCSTFLQSLPIHSTINIEDFTVVSQIGEGSSGKIYLVTNSTTTFAMKKTIVHDVDSIKAFLDEVTMVTSLNHANIVRVHGLSVRGLDATTFAIYVVMEKAEMDWADEINLLKAEGRPYSEAALVELVTALVDALAMLQEKGVAHRDIKPANVLIYKTNGAVYKLADFGEAKTAEEGVNTLRGTEVYMSPLLLRGVKQNKDDVVHDPYKSDVFSLGLCLLHAATLTDESIRQATDCLKNSQG